MNFKHSKESESLEGFEKKFYGAIAGLGEVLCEATEAKPKEIVFDYQGSDEKVLRVTATVDARSLEVGVGDVNNFANVLIGHFPAFFTPSHYRPYITIEVESGRNGKVSIIGLYKEGV